MSGLNIAIATSQLPLPASEQILVQALAAQGAVATPAVWSSSNIDWNQYDAVVVRTCWDYHLRLDEFLAWIGSREDLRIPVINHPVLLRWNAHKTYLKHFEERGIAIPETMWLGAGEQSELSDVCADRHWQQAVTKPIVSASAHATERRNSGLVRGPIMVQQYLPAIETEGEWSLIYFGHEFSHAVRKRPKPADFRVQKDHGGTVETAVPALELRAFADAALRELPYASTFARVDIVEQDEKFYLMEMEVIEPELFLRHDAASAGKMARSILKALPGNTV
jgi:glutathione synthase/RimK-type ligase-like ATP-grasp enzyme